MDELLEAIRTATATDASEEARAAGVIACRTILTALEAKAGEPLVQLPTAPASPIAMAVSALKNVPPDQLLDLAIAKLRTMLPEGVTPPTVDPVKFHVIHLPMPAKGARP
jgi:hypothetical protein